MLDSNIDCICKSINSDDSGLAYDFYLSQYLYTAFLIDSRWFTPADGP